MAQGQIVVFKPVQVLVRFLKRKWAATDDIDPSGASVFADDMAAKTDGPDAVPVMCHLVQVVCPVLEWTDQLVQTYPYLNFPAETTLIFQGLQNPLFHTSYLTVQ